MIRPRNAQVVKSSIEMFKRQYAKGFPSVAHFGLVIVPEGHKQIVETLGKYTATLNPGVHFLIPFIQRIAHDVDIRVKCIEIEREDAYTKDNVQVTVSGNLYIRFNDPVKACYNVDDATNAAVQLAMSTARTSIGKFELNKIVNSRGVINETVTESMRDIVGSWGGQVTGFEITHLDVKDQKVKESLSEQSSAERRRLATELNADAELYRRKTVAEASRIEMEQQGEGEKKYALLKAEGEAQAIKEVGEAIKVYGMNPALIKLASERIESFGKIAGKNSTIVVPENFGSLAGVVTSIKSLFNDKSFDNERV